MQLVGDGVAMWDPMKQKAIGRAEVIEKFGVGPELVCDALALIGDTSRQRAGRARHRPQDRGPAADRVRLARGPAGQPRPDQAAQAARGAGAERRAGAAVLPPGLPRRRRAPAAAAWTSCAARPFDAQALLPVPARQRLQVAGRPDRPGRGRGRGQPRRAQGGGRAALRRRHHAGGARRDPGPRRRRRACWRSTPRPPRSTSARARAGRRLPRGRAGRGLLRAARPMSTSSASAATASSTCRRWSSGCGRCWPTRRCSRSATTSSTTGRARPLRARAWRPIDDTMLISYVLDGASHGHGMDELAQRLPRPRLHPLRGRLRQGCGARSASPRCRSTRPPPTPPRTPR